MKIMIVDDNPKVRAMVRNLLMELKANIIECSDGSEAVEFYPRFTPDWVVMDIVMKSMDGITATKKIMTQYPTAKVMIVSNFDDQAFKDKAKQAGAKGYILKENLTLLTQALHN